MAKRWTKEEEACYRKELKQLYVKENKTIDEISKIIGIAPQTAYDRLKRLGIKTCPQRKAHYNNKRTDVKIPTHYTPDLAEFFGVMLGDGHVSHFQMVVNLGDKEMEYARYVVGLIEKNFHIKPKISVRKKGYKDVYIGSVDVTSWLVSEGLVFNKVKSQVDVPKWIFSDEEFMKRFLRGFFDTDGSVYKLCHGMQISLKNYSHPLLKSLQKMLSRLGYKPSRISSHSVYVTRTSDIERFFKEVQPANAKHKKRYNKLIN
jgi:DNA-binding transcriptional regulator WhiA